MKPHPLRARVLAEWRGVWEEPFSRDTCRTVGECMSKLMDSLGLRDRLKEEEVVQAWGSIVGEFMAQHSTPQKLDKGVLIVRVLQPTLHYELDRVWRGEILSKLKSRFGARTIRDLKFRIG